MTDRIGRGLAIVFLLVLAGGRAPSAQVAAVETSLADYVKSLDALRSAVEASPRETPSAALAGLVDQLPVAWRVQTPQQSFDVSTTWIKRDVIAWREADDAAAAPLAAHQRSLATHLRSLATEAAGFERPAQDPSAAREQLTEIISRREFRNLNGPGWRERVIQRVLEFVNGLLARLFGMSAVPTIASALIYTLIALAVIALAARTYQFFSRDAAMQSIRPGDLPVSAMPWSEWLKMAQAAAAGQQWRDAVHAAYWCAVSFLETRGAWPPDRARTPREYLALLSNSHEHQSALAQLTRRFERVWYGTDRADAAAFDEAVASLKKMGCLPA